MQVVGREQHDHDPAQQVRDPALVGAVHAHGAAPVGLEQEVDGGGAHLPLAERADDGGILLPADQLLLLAGEGRAARGQDGDRLEQVGLALGVVPEKDGLVPIEDKLQLGVVAEILEAQGFEEHESIIAPAASA
ncbi:hypothetical protein D3C87_1728850 [compost metagenome]